MSDLSRWALTALWVVVPGIVLVKGNRFDSRPHTLVRAALATLAAWLTLVVIRLIIVRVDFGLATSDTERQDLALSDGGANAFVLVLGWIPSLVLVALLWAAIAAWRNLTRARPRDRVAIADDG